MVTKIKTFLRSLSEIPEGKFPPSHYSPISRRTIYFGNFAYLAPLVLEATYSLVWLLLKLYALLALILFLAIPVRIVVFILHRNGYFLCAHFLTALLAIILTILYILTLGWGAGFQYFLIVLSATIFYTPWRISIKSSLIGVYFTTYFCMYYYSSFTNPFIAIDPIYLKTLYQLNIVVVCAVLAFAIHISYKMAINSDKKLFEAHQRTSDALEEHDKVLEQLNRELFEAADYVKKILPQPITVGDIRTKWRYIPSTSLGGDAFGYHKLDDDHFAVYLIDVSGHGVGAALLSVSVINMLRSQSLPSTDFKDPEQVLRSLNIAFPSDANKDMFFTIWYGVYNRNTREMTYSSAGHPPAILCDSASSPDCKIDLLKTPNTVVGALGEYTYTKSKCTVEEGDLLYIFSDGVYEVEKADGSMWCFREFTEYVKKLESESKSVLDRLYEHVKQIRKSDHLDDDFTILEVAFA